jgi:hypothetical protein
VTAEEFERANPQPWTHIKHRDGDEGVYAYQRLGHPEWIIVDDGTRLVAWHLDDCEVIR